MNTPAVGWSHDHCALRIIDQRALPERENICELRTLDEVIDAIRTLAVRGAPAIGVAAAIGLVVSLHEASAGDDDTARTLLPEFAARLTAARPTAVNLAWAVERMTARADAVTSAAVVSANDAGSVLYALRVEANAILHEDITMCDAIGIHGLQVIHDGARVLTHCNAGALATAGIGTALAPVYAAHALGRRVHVYVDETRPLRQGARLTAWELQRAGIAVTVLPDSAAASLMRAGAVDLVIVGADRIAVNGDFANKIGTYAVALAAHAHRIPLYVAAPSSTFDARTATGADIEIEFRDAQELGVLPPNVDVWNPAFDVTPRELVTGYVTDRGWVEPPFAAVGIA